MNTQKKFGDMPSSDFFYAYERLNKEQKGWVDTIFGPVLVVAGPGTGKTQVLALRSAKILQETDVWAEALCITTFTEAGVIAIKKRLFSLIGSESYKIYITTLHGFCNDLIGQFPEYFLHVRAHELLDEMGSFQLLQDILEKNRETISCLTSEHDPFYYIHTIRMRINTLKQEGISPLLFLTEIKEEEKKQGEILSQIKPSLKKYESTKQKQQKHIHKLQELQFFYEQYEERKREQGVYDYADMIQFALEALDHKEVSQYYAERFHFFMIDEFQDVNNSQNKLIDKILTQSDEKNLFVVGDDDQSIYRFQGANLENMLQFASKYPDPRIIVLGINYRSTQKILDLASALIQRNSTRISSYIPNISKQIVSSFIKNKNLESHQPSIYSCVSDITEKLFILKDIYNKQKIGIPNHEIAVIVRTNKEVVEWSRFLQQNNISVESREKQNILENPFIEIIFSLFEFLEKPYEKDGCFYDLMRAGIFDIHAQDMCVLAHACKKANYTRSPANKISLFQFFSDIHLNINFLENKDFILQEPEKITQLFHLLKHILQPNIISFYYYFCFVLEKINFFEYLETHEHATFHDFQDVFSLQEKIFTWSKQDSSFHIQSLLQKRDLHKTENISITRRIFSHVSEGVQVLTAHQSKGLEYEAVFIPGLIHGNWGERRVRNLLKLPGSIVGTGFVDVDESTQALEEERRLLFVALTRAKKHLTLTYPRAIESHARLPSQFLLEMVEDVKNIPESPYESKLESKSEYMQQEKNFLYTSQNIFFLSNSKKEVLLSYIDEFLKNYKLSASDINVFLENPHEFLKRSVYKYPFVDTKATLFGKLYHATLEHFFLEYIKTNKIPVFDRLSEIYVSLVSKQFLSPEDEKWLLEKGYESLFGWYESHAGVFVKPFAVEYNFSSHQCVFEWIPLTGSVDAILPLSNEKGTDKVPVVLVDYKTGRIKSENEMKWLTKSSKNANYFRQLIFYKLLASCSKEFQTHYEVHEIAIDFVEGREGKYSFSPFSFSKEEEQACHNEIREAWEKINNIRFWETIL